MTSADQQAVDTGLKHLPVPIFAVAMGLWGWALASHAAASAWQPMEPVAQVLRLLAIGSL